MSRQRPVSVGLPTSHIETREKGQGNGNTPSNLAEMALAALARFMNEAVTFYALEKSRANLLEGCDLVAQLPDAADVRDILETLLLVAKDLPHDHPENPDGKLAETDPVRFGLLFREYLIFVRNLAFDFGRVHKRRMEGAMLRLEVIAAMASPTDEFPELEKLNKSARAMLRTCMFLEANSKPATFSDIEDGLETSTTTNKKSRKSLVDCGLLLPDGKGPDAKWRVTRRGVLVSERLK